MHIYSLNFPIQMSRFGVNDWYDLSYQHYATLAVIVSVVVGSFVSWLTCCNKGRELPRGTYYDVLRPLRCGGVGFFVMAAHNDFTMCLDNGWSACVGRRFKLNR